MLHALYALQGYDVIRSKSSLRRRGHRRLSSGSCGKTSDPDQIECAYGGLNVIEIRAKRRLDRDARSCYARANGACRPA